MILRTAEPKDAPALASCFSEAYSVYDGLGLHLPPVADGVAETIEETPVFIAELNGKIAGGLVLRFGADAQIENVAVSPWAAGQGIGKALIFLAERTARKNGYSVITLATHVALIENHSYYRHLGWVETGREGVKVFMRKSL